MILKDEFRLDLMYRLNTLSLNIPPLRERKEDIKPLVEHFTKKYSSFKGDETYSEDAIKALKSYNYPGNVRELQNIIIRALTTLKGNVVEPKDLKFYFDDSSNGYYGTFDEKIENFERELLKNALEAGNSIRQTAQDLGITHTRLINRIKKYNL